MATNDSKNKSVIVTSDDSLIGKKEHVEKDVEIKNIVVASDDNCISKEVVEVVGGSKNVVTFNDTNRSSEEDHEGNDDGDDDDDDEQETGVDLGIFMDKLNLGPKKKLLVISIGGFLVHRAHCSRPKTILKNRQPDFCFRNFKIYKRPFCEGFLRFCFERFEVGIWSSAMEHNIDDVLTNIMGALKSKLLFTLDQNHCTETRFKCLDNKYKPVFLKELDNIWKKKYIHYPKSEEVYSASNTLLISDPVKALLNPPNTGIFFEDYDPNNNQDDFLGPNSKLRVFLDGLAEAKDVQSYVKDHPIGEPAITTSHADWNYYSKIIHAYGKK